MLGGPAQLLRPILLERSLLAWLVIAGSTKPFSSSCSELNAHTIGGFLHWSSDLKTMARDLFREVAMRPHRERDQQLSVVLEDCIREVCA